MLQEGLVQGGRSDVELDEYSVEPDDDAPGQAAAGADFSWEADFAGG